MNIFTLLVALNFCFFFTIFAHAENEYVSLKISGSENLSIEITPSLDDNGNIEMTTAI